MTLLQVEQHITNGNCSPPVRRFGFQKIAVGASAFVQFSGTTFRGC